ncbi:MAG: universal stress protein [Negativicutes bacterium]|nr:universal stress protein [Negativicutes bacterium]
MNIKKIVVAYDGSTQSKKALDWAIAMGSADTEIIAVTVVRPPEFSPMVSEVDEFYADAERFYQPMLEKVRIYGKSNNKEIKTLILHGHPAESIVHFAYEQKADLIITGTRGLGGFKSLVIGSVAQKVVSYSKIPVLVVKE